MAANKFATMLHRNTHRITVILVYTFLEWILIISLLLNSLFSYLILKFANFFGLKPPCIWCSRVDHVLEPGKDVNSYRDLVCENHAMEISKLGYCSNHRKLARARDMCEDCSSSPRTDGPIAFFSLVKDMGMISGDGRSKIENGEKDSTCSCCGVSLEGGLYSPYLFLKPSWGVLDYTHKGNLIEVGENGFNDCGCSDPSKSNCLTDHDEDEIRNRDGVVENKMISDVFDDEGVERMTAEECSRSLPSFHCESMEGEDEPVQDDSKMSLEGTTTTAFQNSDVNTINQIPVCHGEDASIEIFSPRLENCFGGDDDDDDRLVPVKLIDSMTIEDQNSSKLIEFQILRLLDIESKFQEQVGLIVDTESVVEEGNTVFSINENADDAGSEGTKPKVAMNEETRNENRTSLVFIAEDSDGDLVAELCNRVSVTQATQITPSDGDKIDAVAISVKDSGAHSASEENNKMIDIGTETENLVGIEICKPETVDQHQVHENSILLLACLDDLSSKNYDDTGICNQETVDSPQVHEQSLPSSACADDLSSKNFDGTENSTTGEEFMADHDQEPNQAREPHTVEDCCLESQKEPEIESVERNGEGINHHLSICSELNEVEEEKAPETPTYIEGIPSPHKRLLFERRELGTESLDGSVISEVDGGEVLTIDRMKSALKAERRALGALYTELEEERSASAIAANQTMAMITRLQEEKAAMQMEALQYQRMMEEQSEYDQEALQLLNELMVKREKEKQELEKELELYRKKVFLYEAKQKRSIRKRKANGVNGISSASSSTEDSDELSIDLNEVEDSFYGVQESIQNTPADAVSGSVMVQESEKHLSTLDESLADFEEERLSILEQLKALEEKLFTLGDEEECFDDIKPIEHFAVENGKEVDENYGFCSPDANGDMNGFSDDLSMSRQNYQERGNMGCRAKRLLPLFDAICMENEDELQEEQETSVITQTSVSKFESENKKFAIEEEVENVYERLQALEADREFLKHCVSSLKKGDKGMDLLQEILQHLRNLRTVDLRVKSTSDALV